MLRRSFLSYTIPAMLAAGLRGQEQPDRLSGVVKSIDKKAMVIELTPRNSSAVRKVHYDGSTKFTLLDKASNVDEAAVGMRIVAVGKFQGVELNATQITLRPR